MKLMEGKKGIVFGLSNKRGLAYAISKVLFDHGAELAVTYAGELMKERVFPIAQEMNSQLMIDCDVTKEEEIQKAFAEYQAVMGRIDFIVHAVAFANKEDLQGDISSVSKQGFDLALGVSAYSLLSIVRYAKPLLNEGAAITTLTYMGSEKTVPNYNIMGVAKAALEAIVRYLATELGPLGIRVNALSAGPVKTLAAKGIRGFETLYKISQARSPLKRNVSLEEVGNAGLYLCSSLSGGVTGEVHHVDSGFHSIAVCHEEEKGVE